MKTRFVFAILIKILLLSFITSFTAGAEMHPMIYRSYIPVVAISIECPDDMVPPRETVDCIENWFFCVCSKGA